jgi:hypothetical protein
MIAQPHAGEWFPPRKDIMEKVLVQASEGAAEISPWDDAPPPDVAEEEFDILAFGLVRQASRPDIAAAEETPGEDVPVGANASCL